MMIDHSTFKKAFENATLEEIIKERDGLIRQIRKYEKGKMPPEEFLRCSSHYTEYYCNNLYIYHYLNDEPHGEESQPIFYRYRNLDYPFHLDYIFVSLRRIKNLEIGDEERWIQESCHLPLILKLMTKEGLYGVRVDRFFKN